MAILTDLLKAPDVEAADQIYIVDTSDVTDNPAGSSRRVPLSDLARTSVIKVKSSTITDPGVSGFVFSVPANIIRAHIEGNVLSANNNDTDALNIFYNGGSSTTGYHRQNSAASNGSPLTTESSDAVIANVAAATSFDSSAQYVGIVVDRLQSGLATNAIGTFSYRRADQNIQAGNIYNHSPVTDQITSITISSFNGAALSGTLTLYYEAELSVIALT